MQIAILAAIAAAALFVTVGVSAVAVAEAVW